MRGGRARQVVPQIRGDGNDLGHAGVLDLRASDRARLAGADLRYFQPIDRRGDLPDPLIEPVARLAQLVQFASNSGELAGEPVPTRFPEIGALKEPIRFAVAQ